MSQYLKYHIERVVNFKNEEGVVEEEKSYEEVTLEELLTQLKNVNPNNTIKVIGQILYDDQELEDRIVELENKLDNIKDYIQEISSKADDIISLAEDIEYETDY